MNRKQFIRLSASAGVISFLNAHSLFAGAPHMQTAELANKKNLISSLRLLTNTSLDFMRKFYGDSLGLPVISQSKEELVIQAGKTKLTFIKTNQSNRPFYHFAFNIPENKIHKAFEWQKQRTALINPRPTMTNDPMKEVISFDHWNAHSVFFLDPAGNLLEYIARHDLKNAEEGPFSAKDILYASEIGLVVNDTKAVGKTIIDEYKLDWYKPDANGYWVVGDEHGMLLMITPGMVWTSHPGMENKTDVFKTAVAINTDIIETWKPAEFPYEIRNA